MKNKKEATAKTDVNDSRRFAYMIAWRDQYIAALQERLAGWEEKDVLLCSLLHYALAAAADPNDAQEEFEVQIPKAEIAKRIGEWDCHAEDKDDCYCVRFTKKQQDVAPEMSTEELSDGGEQEEE